MWNFDIDDQNRIAELIDKRKPDAYIMPLYIKVYNDIYDIRDIDKITGFSPSGFKLGFGGSNGLFSSTNFPSQFIFTFSNVNTFSRFNEEYNCNTRYIIFESMEVDEEQEKEHPLFEQINYYYKMIRDYLLESTEKYRKARIEENLKDDQS